MESIGIGGATAAMNISRQVSLVLAPKSTVTLTYFRGRPYQYEVQMGGKKEELTGGKRGSIIIRVVKNNIKNII